MVRYGLVFEGRYLTLAFSLALRGSLVTLLLASCTEELCNHLDDHCVTVFGIRGPPRSR